MKQRSIIKNQSGAVLIVGLVLLLILTIIGLASIRGSDLQERMAGNMRDRNVAFQSAEAALRRGEATLNAALLPSFSGGQVGYWPDLNKQPAIRPRPTSWTKQQWEQNSVQLPQNSVKGVIEQPRYTIEKVVVTGLAASQGSAVDHESVEKMAEAEFFRITARGLGLTADSEVVLQTTFAR